MLTHVHILIKPITFALKVCQYNLVIILSFPYLGSLNAFSSLACSSELLQAYIVIQSNYGLLYFFTQCVIAPWCYSSMRDSRQLQRGDTVNRAVCSTQAHFSSVLSILSSHYGTLYLMKPISRRSLENLSTKIISLLFYKQNSIMLLGSDLYLVWFY